MQIYNGLTPKWYNTQERGTEATRRNRHDDVKNTQTIVKNNSRFSPAETQYTIQKQHYFFEALHKTDELANKANTDLSVEGVRHAEGGCDPTESVDNMSRHSVHYTLYRSADILRRRYDDGAGEE